MFRQSNGTTIKPSNSQENRSSNLYGDVLPRSLRDEHEALLSTEPDAQTQLDSELALMRLSLRDAVEVWGKAEGTAKLIAAEMMEGKIDKVVRVASTIVRNNAQNAVSVHQLHFAMRQMISLAYETMDHATARAFEMLVSQRVHIGEDTSGTTLTPDQDAMEMDATIPLHA